MQNDQVQRVHADCLVVLVPGLDSVVGIVHSLLIDGDGARGLPHCRAINLNSRSRQRFDRLEAEIELHRLRGALQRGVQERTLVADGRGTAGVAQVLLHLVQQLVRACARGQVRQHNDAAVVQRHAPAVRLAHQHSQADARRFGVVFERAQLQQLEHKDWPRRVPHLLHPRHVPERLVDLPLARARLDHDGERLLVGVDAREFHEGFRDL